MPQKEMRANPLLANDLTMPASCAAGRASPSRQPLHTSGWRTPTPTSTQAQRRCTTRNDTVRTQLDRLSPVLLLPQSPYHLLGCHGELFEPHPDGVVDGTDHRRGSTDNAAFGGFLGPKGTIRIVSDYIY